MMAKTVTGAKFIIEDTLKLLMLIVKSVICSYPHKKTDYKPLNSENEVMKDKERYCKLKKRSVEPALHFTPNEVFVKEIALFFCSSCMFRVSRF